MKYNLDYFLPKDYSFVLIGNKKVIYQSKSQRLAPLVFCLKRYRKEMKGAVVYDKIVGLAAAKLLAYGRVAEVWTSIVSKRGLKYLRENKIKVEYKKEVKNILNKKSDDICPMEKMSKGKSEKEICKIFRIE